MTYRSKTLTVALASAGLAMAVGATPAQAQPSDTVPSFNGTVLTVAYAGNTVFLGGDFTAAIVKGKQVPRAHVAAVDARTGTLLPWSPATDGRVKALVVHGSSVYLAGDFATVAGVPRDSLARVHAGTGAVSGTFRHTINGRPLALAAGNGRLYLGGSITAINGQARPRLAAFSLTSGVLDAKWRPATDDFVETITAGAGRVYAGGRFRKVNNIAGYERLAALDPVGGKLVTGFRPRPAVIAFAVAVAPDGGVYSAHGGQGGRVSAYTGAGKLRWSATFDGDAQAVTVLDDTVYAGGHFDRACSTARTGAQGTCVDGSDNRVKLAALDPADGHLLDWTADANGVSGVYTLAGSATLGVVGMGGAFTTVDGLPQKRFAQFS